MGKNYLGKGKTKLEKRKMKGEVRRINRGGVFIKMKGEVGREIQTGAGR